MTSAATEAPQGSDVGLSQPQRSTWSRIKKSWRRTLFGRYRLTLLGRCTALLLGELAANLLLWIIALAMFAPDRNSRGVLSLCLIAWTLGLRHGLDADHIVAIDNATRRIVSLGKEPICVGLFFSLGHSSIVLGATIAIVVAVSAIDKIPDVSAVGGIIAILNSIILYTTIREHRRRRRNADVAAIVGQVPLDSNLKMDTEEAETKPDLEKQASIDKEESSVKRKSDPKPKMLGLQPTTCLARIGKPVFKMIDASWKMYPVGVLFGFGFDTASEITLLGVSAIASTHDVPRSEILILPFLFTAGMTLVDSLDSVFMLNAYIMPGRHTSSSSSEPDNVKPKSWWRRLRFIERRPEPQSDTNELDIVKQSESKAYSLPQANQDKLLKIQIVLTVMSILIAFLISWVQFMSLALEKCTSCADAAENDPGLSGRWWRFWAELGDDSTYIGAGVVALFVIVFGTWLAVHEWRKWQARKHLGATSIGKNEAEVGSTA
ncbi:hypothetical protein OIO90_004648 [Microbotryomycetes sp. JL221]|nr:hypothetical protein OIO90_004648 [Microbotryomycetes sp. JL221]